MRAARAPLELLVRSLLSHAIAATPREGEVVADVHRTELGVTLSVSDGGPPVPEAARWETIRHRTDPTSLGRPAGVSLVLADAAATALSADLELRESPDAHSEVWVVFRKA